MSSPSGRRPYDFNGNHLAVDFTNTVNSRPRFTRDDLVDVDDVFEWAAAAGLPTGAAGVNRGSTGPTEFEGIIELREQVYRVLGPIAESREPDANALAFVARRAAAAIASAEWVKVGSTFEPRWP